MLSRSTSPIMKKALLFLPILAMPFLGGCEDEPYYGRVAYADRPAYYGRDYYGPGEVDFYYTGGRPYSHRYGSLVIRENRYYYSRGGRYYVYERGPHPRHYVYRRSAPYHAGSTVEIYR